MPLLLRSLLLLLAAALLPLTPMVRPACAAEAQVAILVSYDGAAFQQVAKGIREALQPRGGVEVQTHLLTGSETETARVLNKLRRKPPTLLVALGSLALTKAAQELPQVPILGSMVLHRDSFRQYPNVTGVALEYSVALQFDWLKRFLPEVRTLGVLYNPEENQARIDEAMVEARRFGFELQPRPVPTPRDLPAAMESLANRADALWGIDDSVVLTPQTAKNLLLFSFRNRIPFVGLSTAWVKAGATYALDRDYVDLGAQCGVLALKLLDGAKPASLPPETPRKVLCYYNPKTVEQMKLTIPADVLRQAQQL